MEKDYYNILGVSRNAKKEEIIRAYRKLAAKYHPDKHQGNPLADLAEEKFKEINEAYHTLVGDDLIFTSISESKSGKSVSKKKHEDISKDAKDLLYDGINFFNEGNYQKAIQNFNNALRFSKNSNLYNLLGLAYCETGEYRKALEPLVRATELDRTNGKYFFDAGYAYYHLKVWDSAIQYLLEAYNLLEDEKRLAATCVHIAICNYNIGKIARTEFFLDEAVTYDPENASYRVLLNEFKLSQESEGGQKWKTAHKVNRFSLASRLEESLGNLFHTLFSK
jgi:molecular chaperone DnaJ